jgi:hypothetical protein
MKKILLIAAYLIVNLYSSTAQQNEVMVGTYIPLYYSIGYQQKVAKNFSLTGNIGFLTKPYDKLILDILKAFDTDELLVNTIGEAFSYGLSIQPAIRYHARKSYFGASYSYLMLVAHDNPSEIISNYFGIYFPGRRTASMILKSGLHNAGLYYGRKFKFQNPSLSLNLEFSLLKTLASASKLETETVVDLKLLSNTVDNKLNSYYVKYGVLPSINVFLTYTLNKD